MSLEELDNKRKRLLFRSEHRGTKEMDLIMGSFARQNLAAMSEAQLALYEDLLQNNDPDLYNWITEKEPVPANIDSEIFQRVKSHNLVQRD